MEETASFLQSLLASHGPNYLEKLFGTKARDTLKPLGGVNTVAIALSGNYHSFFIIIFIIILIILTQKIDRSLQVYEICKRVNFALN